ncbi:hypothetical protein EFY79_15745 [Hanamia caeni]|uniref:Uncharacterized protein n=1 Tax=Hanamia caeni TaxID=2294116 RepID=A0A3M9NA47_9BACT|nr:hypothetical protein EFY79_15745 [Hanamia caeni]
MKENKKSRNFLLYHTTITLPPAYSPVFYKSLPTQSKLSLFFIYINKSYNSMIVIAIDNSFFISF